MMEIGKYSFGMGDRFAHQGRAQLQSCLLAQAEGAEVVPVWNKSNREHTTIGTQPQSARDAADQAVNDLGYTGEYHLDADHINLDTVDGFLDCSDFFTLDVADSIGKPAGAESVSAFVDRHPELIGSLSIPAIDEPFEIDRAYVEGVANQFLLAVQQAGEIYRHIESEKGADSFITEVSMDETDAPQTPPDLLIILAALADEKIPVQTIAPKFTGRFNKGVDYVGDVAQFTREFNQDLAVIDHAVAQYGLPHNLKLSVHSGSDKFSIYQPIREALAKFDAGLHIKTAGTTWLEELIGLAEAGGEGLALAKEIYADSLTHQDELCAPYATVIDIDPAALPDADTVGNWTGEQYVNALRHDPSHPEFNPSLRQLLHVGYKMAAKKGSRYLDLLVVCEESVARNVTGNLYERHLKPLFLAGH